MNSKYKFVAPANPDRCHGMRAKSLAADILEQICRASCNYKSIVCFCLRGDNIKFEPFSRQKFLEILRLQFKWKGGVVFDQWSHFNKFHHLSELVLLNFRRISINELRHITNLKSLKNLSLGRISTVFEEGMLTLAKLENLENLHLEAYAAEKLTVESVLKVVLLMPKVSTVKLVDFAKGREYPALCQAVAKSLYETIFSDDSESDDSDDDFFFFDEDDQFERQQKEEEEKKEKAKFVKPNGDKEENERKRWKTRRHQHSVLLLETLRAAQATQQP